MTTEKKPRSSNIELLRIVAMFMIILFHITVHCVTVQLSDPKSLGMTFSEYFSQPVFHWQILILAFLGTLGIISNAIFILISGYFMANKDKESIKMGTISQKLLLQLGFASLLLACVPPLIHIAMPDFSVKMLGISSFNNLSWFVGYYFLIMLCGRLFYNDFLSKLDYKKYTAFLLTLFAFTEFGWSRGRVEALAGGLGVVCIGLFLYALGGYIKRFDPFAKIKASAIVLTLIIIHSLVLLSSYNLTVTKIFDYMIKGTTKPFIPVIPGYDNWSIITVASAICLFELFRRINLPYSKIINYLGKATFMIYLLHDNSVFYNLWNHRNWVETLTSSPLLFIFHILKWSAFTFMLGTIAYALYDLCMKALASHKHLFYKSDKT